MADQQFLAILTEFLKTTQNAFPIANEAPLHMRFPSSERSTVLGSPTGKDFWESEPAQMLVENLYSDEVIASYLRPPENQEATELQGILASYVGVWNASGLEAAAFANNTASELLAELRLNERACTAFRVVNGIEMPNETDGANLSFGITILPASRRNLTQLFLNAGMNPIEIVKVPAGPAALVVIEQRVSRDDMGPLASVSAFGFSVVLGIQVRMALWLASGRLPTLGDAFAFEKATYPAIQHQQVPAALERKFPPSGEAWTLDQEAVDQLDSVLRRVAVLWGWVNPRSEDETTRRVAWTALTYLDSALNTADWALVLLLSYSAIDGLLLSREESDSFLVYRTAWLIGRSDSERRDIRRFIDKLYFVRSKVAHGERPANSELARLAGEDEGGNAANGHSPDLELRVKNRCLELARRASLAFIWLALDHDEQGLPYFRRTKSEIVGLLDAAHQNDVEAKNELSSSMPLELFRDPL